MTDENLISVTNNENPPINLEIITYKNEIGINFLHYIPSKTSDLTNDSNFTTQTYVDNRLTNIINSAPAGLDTLKELADAINNDTAFASTMTTALSGKVDKISGKDLSTNDLTNELKTAYDGAVTNEHTHSNKTILDGTTAGFTTALKSNYDTAYSKITNLQKINVLDYGAFGNDTTDDTSAFTSAITYAASLATSGSYLGKITLYVPHGKYKITSQLTIPKNVDLHCEGVLYNHLTDKWQPMVIFQPGSHCSSLKIYGNLGSGAAFGTNSVYSNSNIGDIRLWNIGCEYDGTKGPKIGVSFTGYNFNFNSIEIDGGNIAVDFNTASDVRGNYILAWGASSGIRITSGCEHIHIGYAHIDTPSYIGLQIDSSHDINLNAQIFLNDQQSPSAISNAAIIGNYSSGDNVNNLKLDLRVQNTGGTALNLSNIKNSTIHLIATNSLLATGNSHNITTGLVLGSNVNASTYINANIDSSITTAISGSGGTLNIGSNTGDETNSTILSKIGFTPANSSTAPVISSGSDAPTSTPAKVGDIYVDTTNYKTYIAKGSSSSSDWVKQNGSYVLQASQSASINPADATTYYFGACNANVNSWNSSANAANKLYFPRAGTVNFVSVNTSVGTVGSSETSSLYLRINNTTDYLISNSVLSNSYNLNYQVSNLGVPVSAGDYCHLKCVTATWATNPLGFTANAQITIDL